MNAIIIDPFGWITISRAAELKGFSRSTLVDFIEEKGIPTRKMKNNVCVRLSDIDEAISEEDGKPKSERGGHGQAPPQWEVAAPTNGKRKAVYRASLPDAI